MNSHGSFPIKGTFLPDVPEPNDELGDKHHHRDEAVPAQFTHGDAPWEEECRFQIKQNKQNRDQIVPDVEFHARVFEGFEAALVGGEFCRIGTLWPEQIPEHLGCDADTDANQDEEKNGEVIFEVHGGAYLNDRVNETTACLQRRIAQSWLRTCHQDRTTDPRKKASSGMRAIARLPLLAFLYILVPTARLELAQLAPLPPQDSVSTNFTTSAGDQYSTLL